MAHHSNRGNLISGSSVGQCLLGPAMSLSAPRPPKLATCGGRAKPATRSMLPAGAAWSIRAAARSAMNARPGGR